MKSFSSFCKENTNAKKESEKERASDEGVSREKIQETYDELKDLNSDELTNRLYSEVRKQKKNGTFNFESLCDGVERMRPFISNETYQNMKNMLGKIK